MDFKAQVLETKEAIQSWLRANDSYVDHANVTETEYEFSVSVIPKAKGASPILLKVSKSSPEVDIGAGSRLTVSDYKYRGKEEVLAILEAIKAGQVEECISSFLGLTVEATGKISARTGSVHSKAVNLLGIGSLLPKSERQIRYQPWHE